MSDNTGKNTQSAIGNDLPVLELSNEDILDVMQHNSGYLVRGDILESGFKS